MKKKNLVTLFVIITTAFFLTGCGEQEAESNKENFQVSKESETQEISSENEDSKLIKKIDWTWSVSDYELYNTMMKQEEANLELFSGIIDYSDGHQETVKADSVDLIWEDGSTMVVEVEFRGKKFPYKVEIKDNWGDGEKLSEEELEQLKQEEQEQGSEVVDVNKTRFSLEDAPELTNVDWDLFNEVAAEFLGKSYYLDLQGFYEELGSDPRIDWVEINESFNKYYGNSYDSMMTFVNDLFDTYYDMKICYNRDLYLVNIKIEPTRSNDENGVYESLHEEYNQRNKYGGYSSPAEQDAYNDILSCYSNSQVSSKAFNFLSGYIQATDEPDEAGIYFASNRKKYWIDRLKIYDVLVREYYSDYYDEYLLDIQNKLVDSGYEDIDLYTKIINE